MREASRRTLIVGWRGGVGRAVSAVLETHPLGRALLAGRAPPLLLDAEPGTDAALPGAVVLPAERVQTGARVRELIRAHGVDEVVDLAGLDWRECLDACAAEGARYLCTSLERWDPGSRATILDDACVLADADAPRWSGAHVVAAGMNPGCVNALVAAAMHELSARVGVPADVDALELGSILVTELDTTHALDETRTPDEPGAFAMSWGPEPCLAELSVPHALVVQDGRVHALPHGPCDARYRVRCGDDTVEGFVVPHDELVSLAARYRGPELAYVYRVPDAARRWLATPAAQRSPAHRRLWPPHTLAIAGIDRVGVLLGSRRFGELWCGFETNVADALRLGTNATLLQVAAGVLAAWRQLDAGTGVRVVEQLDGDAYLSDVGALLGAKSVVHDPHAPFTPLVDRRC